MSEAINKQCPYCGEYIPLNSEVCSFCGETLQCDDNNTNEETIENTNIEEVPTSEADNTTEDTEPKKGNKKNKVKFLIIFSSIFIAGLLLTLLTLAVINKNTDVAIGPSEHKKISVPKVRMNTSKLNKAKELYKDKNIDKAAEIFQTYIDSENNPIAYYYMGEIYRDEGYTKIALSYYKKALEYKKGFFEAQKRLADVYLQKDEIDLALDYAIKANKQKPKDLELLKTMVEIYSRQDNTDKLLATHKKIVSIDKKDYSSNYFLANYYYDLERYKEAIPYLKNILNAEYNTDIAYGLAVCYSRIEYYTKAIEVLDLIIKKDPSEYYSATYAKSRVSDLKDYYNAIHNPQPPKQHYTNKSYSNNSEGDNYDNDAEDSLF